MARGRKSIPSEVKRLTGNPGKRPLNDDAPVFEQNCEPPKGLTGRAREEWDVVAGALAKNRMLTDVDRSQLAAYCMAVQMLFDARAAIKKNKIKNTQSGLASIGLSGMFYMAPGGLIKKHPAVAIMEAAMKQIRGLGSEFGFSPSARNNVKAPCSTKADELGEFIDNAGSRNNPGPFQRTA